MRVNVIVVRYKMHPKINRKFVILSQTFSALSKGINRANMKTKIFNGKNAGDRSFKNIANDLKKIAKFAHSVRREIMSIQF